MLCVCSENSGDSTGVYCDGRNNIFTLKRTKSYIRNATGEGRRALHLKSQVAPTYTQDTQYYGYTMYRLFKRCIFINTMTKKYTLLCGTGLKRKCRLLSIISTLYCIGTIDLASRYFTQYNSTIVLRIRT